VHEWELRWGGLAALGGTQKERLSCGLASPGTKRGPKQQDCVCACAGRVCPADRLAPTLSTYCSGVSTNSLPPMEKVMVGILGRSAQSTTGGARGSAWVGFGMVIPGRQECDKSEERKSHERCGPAGLHAPPSECTGQPRCAAGQADRGACRGEAAATVAHLTRRRNQTRTSRRRGPDCAESALLRSGCEVACGVRGWCGVRVWRECWGCIVRSKPWFGLHPGGHAGGTCMAKAEGTRVAACLSPARWFRCW
jgi:hypothetical protein